MARPAATTFLPGQLVTHDEIGGYYVVEDSHRYYTDVTTNDDEALDIAFATVDLRLV